MTDNLKDRQGKRVICVITEDEAKALVDFGAALEGLGVLVRGCAFDTATSKLDEQTAAQLRPVVDEAADELDDQLLHEMPETLTPERIRQIAEAVVHRVLGLWE